MGESPAPRLAGDRNAVSPTGASRARERPGAKRLPAWPQRYASLALSPEPGRHRERQADFHANFRVWPATLHHQLYACDGAGRPGSTGPVAQPGVGRPRIPDPFKGPRFTGLSGPDANWCASCHNEPGVGGAASFRGNLAEGAQDCDPVAGVDLSRDLFGLSPTLRPCRAGVTPTPTVSDGFFPTFNERGSLGLFGSGAIELLGREMTDDLLNLQTQAIAQAKAVHQNVTVTLQTKGVQFGTLTAHPDGS